jgi:hypothetical protein
MKFKEQQEDINMLIELANNLTENLVSIQKSVKYYDKKIENLVSLQQIVCKRLDYIENFLDQNFGGQDKDQDKDEKRIIN